MKRTIVVLFLSAIMLNSCLSGDNEGYPVFAYGKIQEVEVPAAFKVDSVSEFTVRYSRPNTCYLFNGFYYRIEGNTRTVAVNYAYINRDNCTVEPNPVYEAPLKFTPRNSGTYLFKFWTGEDPEGVDQFIEIQAIVP
jgi:hypothetical protein